MLGAHSLSRPWTRAPASVWCPSARAPLCLFWALCYKALTPQPGLTGSDRGSDFPHTGPAKPQRWCCAQVWQRPSPS